MSTAQLNISKAIETAIGSDAVRARLEASRRRALMSGNVRKLMACEAAIAMWENA